MLRTEHQAHGTASLLEQCGRQSWVATCGACGTERAAWVVKSSCGLRVCPWCSRRASKEKCERLRATVAYARGMAAQYGHVTWTKVRREREAVEARRERAEERLVLARSEKGRARARRTIARATRELRRLKSWGAALLRTGAWRERMVTFTAAWDPSDPREYTVQRIREKTRKLWKQWDALWQAWSKVGGCAGAYGSLELSTGGHVHLHVVYFGPWVARRGAQPPRVGNKRSSKYRAKLARALQPAWAWKTARRGDPRAGPPDVRELKGEGGLREGTKYATKMVSPLSHEWIGGAKRKVMHPRLAAAWLVATGSQQLCRWFGCFRDQVGRVKESGASAGYPPQHCVACGATLAPVTDPRGWHLEETAAVARAARDKWRAGLQIQREI